MPVGRRSRVWTSQSWSRRLRMVSPAPPSNRTLSGRTMAARPLILSRLRTCCRKLSCVLPVVAQKSSRRISLRSFTSSPSWLMMVTGVEDAGGQAQQGVDVAIVEEAFADGFAGAAFKQDVIGQDDGGAAIDLEQAADVL